MPTPQRNSQKRTATTCQIKLRLKPLPKERNIKGMTSKAKSLIGSSFLGLRETLIETLAYRQPVRRDGGRPSFAEPQRRRSRADGVANEVLG